MPQKNNIISFGGGPRKYDAAAEREANIIGSRIAAARKNSGLSLVAFSRLLEEYGVQIASVSINKWELGDSAPNAYQLMAVCHALNIENANEYFTGSYRPVLNKTGMDKLEDYRQDLMASGRYAPETETEDFENIEYTDMPVSFLTASAGTGSFLDEGNFEYVSFPKSSVPRGADFALHVSGDSMEPVYHDGQIVWVKKCCELSPGSVGIFIYGENGYIKVYGEKEPSEEDAGMFTDSYGVLRRQPVMISYNKKYAPIEVSGNIEFEIVGKVIN